jgi:hypothetical protein
MRSEFPRLSVELLGRLTVHELIRDFPEVAPVLRALGLEFQDAGGDPLPGEMVSSNSIRGRILAATGWRDRLE